VLHALHPDLPHLLTGCCCCLAGRWRADQAQTGAWPEELEEQSDAPNALDRGVVPASVSLKGGREHKFSSPSVARTWTASVSGSSSGAAPALVFDPARTQSTVAGELRAAAALDALDREFEAIRASYPVPRTARTTHSPQRPAALSRRSAPPTPSTSHRHNSTGTGAPPTADELERTAYDAGKRWGERVRADTAWAAAASAPAPAPAHSHSSHPHVEVGLASGTRQRTAR
jgi:hypothetical protein